MRTYRWAAILFLFSCAHHPSSTATPAPDKRTVTGRIVITDRPDTLPPPPAPDARMAAAMRRSDSLAAVVDTIAILYPDSILLHVGQSSRILDSLQLETRRESGEIVHGAGMDVSVEDMRFAQPREAGLTGLNAGRTRLVVKLISVNRAQPPHAPPSYVPIIVLP